MPNTRLLYGHDANLLATREMVLRWRGFHVVQAANDKIVQAILEPTTADGRRVDLLLLCHSLRPEESLPWIEKARIRWPWMKQLLLAYPAQVTYYPLLERLSSVQLFDASRGPEALLRHVEELLGTGLCSCDGPGRDTADAGQLSDASLSNSTVC